MTQMFVGILKYGLLKNVGSETTVRWASLVTSGREYQPIEILSLLMSYPCRVGQLLGGGLDFLV